MYCVFQWPEAVELYRASMRSWMEHEDKFRTDALQVRQLILIHASSPLRLLILDRRASLRKTNCNLIFASQTALKAHIFLCFGFRQADC